jgi:hypothetical protein
MDARALAHLTADYVASWSTEDSERYNNLISRAFAVSGDPERWEHFADLPEEVRDTLSRAFAGWTELQLLQDSIESGAQSPAPGLH